MSTVPLKNKYKLPGTGKEIPYQGYGYGSVFNVPAIFTNPGQGQYPGGTPPTFPPGSGYPPGYPPVDPRTLPQIPQRQRGPQPGELQLPTPNPDQNRVITPGEAAQIPADTGPTRFDPDLINKGYPAPYDPGGWGGANPPPPGTVGQQPPAPGAPRGGIGGFFDKLTSSPNVESMYTAGSILAGNPQPNESQMQQIIRSVGGAMSTRGAYAQMQRAQAEAARKADLEWRDHQIRAQEAATRQKEAEERVRTGDRKVDVDIDTQRETVQHNRATEGIQATTAKGTADLRVQQIEELKNRASERQKLREQRQTQFEATMKITAGKENRESLKAQHDYDDMLEDNERAWEQLKINRINAMAQDRLARMAPIMKAAESMYSTVLMFDKYNVPVEQRGKIMGQIEQWMEDRQNGKNTPFPTFDMTGITPPPAAAPAAAPAATLAAPAVPGAKPAAPPPAPGAKPAAAAPAAAPAANSQEIDMWGRDQGGPGGSPRWVRVRKRPDGTVGYMHLPEDDAGPPR